MAPRSGAFKVELEGRGPLTLRDSNYVATGGEGSVYRAGDTAIKLFTDPTKMKRGMANKIGLLSQIRHPYISAPQGIVLDERSTPIGFYGTFAEGEPLARVFTNAFRTREKFGDDQAKQLVDRMRETVQCGHDHHAVLGDANEMNWVAWLQGKNGPEPRIFDVDSWGIGQFPVTAIMPSIRDWHTKGFTALSDWFSWGIVTFQVFTGIHPYRGTLDPYKPGEFEERMKQNASVFSSRIRLNSAVRDFKCIPGPLLSWYEAAFQKGERVMPPSPYDKGVAAIAPAARTMRATTTQSGALVFEKLLGNPNDPAIRVFHCGAVLANSGSVYDLATKKKIGALKSRTGEVVKVKDGWLLADRQDSRLLFAFVDERTLAATPLTFGLSGRQFVRFENRLFLVTDSELVELRLLNVGKPLLSIGTRTPILTPLSTKWYDGVGIQEAFGAKFLVAPFGEAACMNVRIRELDGLKVVSAKAGNRFVSVIATDKSGAYRKFEFTFSANYASYTAWQGGADGPELNVAILPSTVCATIVTDGELVVFVPLNGNINRVKDSKVTAAMQLSNWNSSVVYIQDGDVWKVRMK